jgi:hypothetical protein
MTVTATEAEFGAFCPGFFDVLSIGKGDLRLDVGGSPEDRERAKEIIGEMLEKGYSIFVETDDGPVRVMGFIASRMTYVIPDEPALDVEPTPPVGPEPGDDEPAQAPPKKRRGSKKEVPVEGSRATAVGRTAGG